MFLASRGVNWALPIIFGLLALGPAFAEPGLSPSHQEPPQDGVRTIAEKGAQALQENKSDSALELFMQAHRMGMSKDSLYYFLAEAALAHSAFDTAMAFNLSISSPENGPFRESVLNQRYRLYTQTGLNRDASKLADSMSVNPIAFSKRSHEFDILISSGYFREDNYQATDYPFGMSLGGFESDGPQYRNRSRLLWPLFESGNIPWSAGLEYDLIKSYVKDSLDYRAGLQIKADNLFRDSISLALTAEIGNVTGTGLVSSYKLESAYLSLSETGITLVQGGFESEWNSDWGNRFSGFWATFYRDCSLRTGKGINYSFSASGIRVDPIQGEIQRVMYVDDVTKAKPTHYSDARFQDTLSGKIAAFLKYTSNTGTYLSSTSPQSLLTFLPTLGYGFPLPFAFSCEIGGHYMLTLYPDAYAWTEASLPESLTIASGDFRGFALNQADGKHYVAILIQGNGGFQEYYGKSPVVEKTRLRIDNQLGADLWLRRRLKKWGTFTLDGTVKRNWTTLAGINAIWIPKWDLGGELKWSRGWRWL